MTLSNSHNYEKPSEKSTPISFRISLQERHTSSRIFNTASDAFLSGTDQAFLICLLTVTTHPLHKTSASQMTLAQSSFFQISIMSHTCTKHFCRSITQLLKCSLNWREMAGIHCSSLSAALNIRTVLHSDTDRHFHNTSQERWTWKVAKETFHFTTKMPVPGHSHVQH
jgi:hypothetical protein